MRKLVFFDVDGTLLPEGVGRVPESAVKAIEELQSRDCGAILCTGRHPIELKQLDLLQYGFDGFVLLNGQLVLDRDMKVISSRTIEGNDKEELLRLFHSMTVPMILVEKDRLYMNFHNEHVVRTQSDISSPVYDIGKYGGADIYMATVFLPRDGEVRFTNLTVSRWHDLALDVFLPDGGKVYGIRKFMEREGLDRSDVIAFGDGDNDIGMLRFAGLGIAMGNAPENVKREADYVTDRVEENGILNALVKFHIIG